MLNYVWISLIAIGILVAAGNDVNDEMRNTYKNGVTLQARFEVSNVIPGPRPSWGGSLVLGADDYNSFYGGQSAQAEIRQAVTISTLANGERSLSLVPNESTPVHWKEMAKTATAKDKLTGIVRSLIFDPEGRAAVVQVEFEPVRFVKMKAVTQAAFDIVGIAVNIALGLIGIMALWLGVMKVAEEAGLLKVLTRLLTPVTRRLFPDVPPDHPAVGAMIMNIAANMLGLSNAATPLGLKAMEELNKLNPKVGTATNAMVTFLAINTGGLILIPATAIAVRAAAGSANPGIIIGTSIIGAGCATIAGVIASKLLQRLPRYRKALEVSNG
ncbi:MAG TPA: nucleoside recognition domain-containing protein [Bacteroidota bacterium]|nr:nucleoside recognition domain-containing protein [Bacteroidota bacterium]